MSAYVRRQASIVSDERETEEKGRETWVGKPSETILKNRPRQPVADTGLGRVGVTEKEKKKKSKEKGG